MTSADALTWTPYDSRGTRSRVRAAITRGGLEFELCAEGGLYVIRSTDRSRGRPVVLETARGRESETREVWRTLVAGLPAPDRRRSPQDSELR